MFNIRTRQYIYGILLAASPLGIYYGIVDATSAGLWLVFGSAVLGLSNGLALLNTKQGRHSG